MTRWFAGYHVFLVAACASVGSACGGAETADDTSDATEACDTVVADADCDNTLRPIVFIHGTFGSATEISNTALLFGSNGYCQDRFVAVEYDSLGGNPLAELSSLVDKVLADTGFDQVDLMGHSQGTRHACSYLEDPDNAAKVARYVNISGLCAGQGVPTLSLSSENDLRNGVVHPPGDHENLERVTLVEEDHVAVAGSKNAFIAMYTYLIGKDPEHTTVQCGADPITIVGKAVTFGDNLPRAGGRIDVFEVDAYADTPWERSEPVATMVADAAGNVSAELKRNVAYEFRGMDPDGNILGYIYMAPFKRSNHLVRFLSPSNNPAIAGLTTDNVVTGPDHVALVARQAAGAFRPDWNNSLKVDGVEVLNEELTGRNDSVIGLFMYDANQNGHTDSGITFSQSFVRGTDLFMDATSPRWMEIEWINEEERITLLKIPNWPSSEAMASMVLP